MIKRKENPLGHERLVVMTGMKDQGSIICRGGTIMLEATYTLANGVQIPKIGFGTWMIDADADAAKAVH
ncbi:hypothetical protein PJM32_29735 [Mycobacterium kansasii]